jgi:HEPN domain-containing protein
MNSELVRRWLDWADNDYIAARRLLLSDLLVQGSGLSNTAIEKYLKTLFVALNLKFPRGYEGHNICTLYEKLKAEKGLDLEINEEYLALLFKSYPLRYPDDLKTGFNIVLCRTKLLVELDHTVYEIRKGISFENAGKTIDTSIETLQKRGDPALLDKNCYFGNYDRATIFKEISPCYELRVFKDDVLVETFMSHEGIEDNGKFDVEALKPNGKNNFLFGERSPIHGP